MVVLSWPDAIFGQEVLPAKICPKSRATRLTRKTRQTTYRQQNTTIAETLQNVLEANLLAAKSCFASTGRDRAGGLANQDF
jgi:hypothetical protein